LSFGKSNAPPPKHDAAASFWWWETVTPDVHDGDMFENNSSSFVRATIESDIAPGRPMFGGCAGATRLLSVDDERLEAELVQLAADITAGMSRWFDLIAAYDDRRIWEQWECRSMASWLASHVGVSLITARQYVYVAHAIQHFPILKAEFAAGRLAYSRVRAVVRCVTPDTEAAMVNMAKHATAPQLERFAAGVDRVRKRATPGDDETGWANRELHLTLDDDGTWILRGRLPGEVGVALRRALDAEVQAQRLVLLADASASGSTTGDVGLEPIESRRVDALDTLTKRGHHATATDGNELRPLVVVHRYPDGNELEDGPAISDVTADRLECEADVIEAVHVTKVCRRHNTSNNGAANNDKHDCDECQPEIRLNRKARRTPRATMRRWLMDRDQGCRFNGCGRKAHLHSHHVVEYGRGGRTTTKNLIMLCDVHHRAVHNHGWIITGDPSGQLTFTRPGLAPIRPHDGDIERLIANISGPISPTRYAGDRFDLNYIVSVFLDAQEYEARDNNMKDDSAASL
jgi:hypothetical protein